MPCSSGVEVRQASIDPYALIAEVRVGALDGRAVAGELEQPARITLSMQSSATNGAERLMSVVCIDIILQ